MTRRPHRRPSRDRSPAPLAVTLLALAVIGIGWAGWVNRSRPQPAAAPGESPPEIDPFADLDDERGPRRGISPGGRRRSGPVTADDGLLADPTWTSAVALAERAFDLVAEAEAAELAGDRSTFADRAVAARDLLSQAIEATASWETDIQAARGETAPVVRKIVRERNRWFDQRAKYRRVGK